MTTYHLVLTLDYSLLTTCPQFLASGNSSWELHISRALLQDRPPDVIFVQASIYYLPLTTYDYPLTTDDQIILLPLIPDSLPLTTDSLPLIPYPYYCCSVCRTSGLLLTAYFLRAAVYDV